MIKTINCDILESGADIICHQVNCQGVMGSGLAKQLKERYPRMYEEYVAHCKWNKDHHTTPLGSIVAYWELPYWSSLLNGLPPGPPAVVGLYGQNYYGIDKQHTDYKALESSLWTFYNIFCTDAQYYPSVAIPYGLGCGLGGGDWEVVHKIICDVFDEYDGEVLICKL